MRKRRLALSENESCTKTDSQTALCPCCGAVMPKEAVICAKCGTQSLSLSEPSSIASIAQNNEYESGGIKPKNRLISFLLCLFLGFLGAHKFYEGKTGMGVLYILTLGIFGVGIVVDLIIILSKPNSYYA